MPPEVLQAFLRMVMQQQQQAQPAFDPLYGLPDAARQSQMPLAMNGPPGGPSMAGLDPVTLDMIRGSLGQQLPPGLPLVVQDQIRNQPSYGEGEIMAPERWWNPALGGQDQRSGPQREDRLLFDRQEALGIPGTSDAWSWARPEGGVWSSRPPGVSPYASPPSQGWRGFPMGLY